MKRAIGLDEINYLSKRLDSFCIGENTQFQEMAKKFNLTDARGFINLTFCCQQATVIKDFFDPE